MRLDLWVVEVLEGHEALLGVEGEELHVELAAELFGGDLLKLQPVVCAAINVALLDKFLLEGKKVFKNLNRAQMDDDLNSNVCRLSMIIFDNDYVNIPLIL